MSSDFKLTLPNVTGADNSAPSKNSDQPETNTVFNMYGVPKDYQKGQWLRQHIGRGYRYFAFTPILARRNDMELVQNGVPQFNPYATAVNPGSNVGNPGVVPISELEKANTEIQNLRNELKALRGN